MAFFFATSTVDALNNIFPTIALVYYITIPPFVWRDKKVEE